MFAWACYLKILSLSLLASLHNSTTANNGEENSSIKRRIDHFVANRLSPFDFFLCQYNRFPSTRDSYNAHKRFLCSNSSFSVTFFSFFYSARAVENDPIDWRSLFPSSMRHELKIKTERSKKIFPSRGARTRRSAIYTCRRCFPSNVICERRGCGRRAIAHQPAAEDHISTPHRSSSRSHKSSCSSVHLEVY